MISFVIMNSMAVAHTLNKQTKDTHALPGEHSLIMLLFTSVNCSLCMTTSNIIFCVILQFNNVFFFFSFFFFLVFLSLIEWKNGKSVSFTQAYLLSHCLI
jgi:hypothetical protein